MSVIRWVFVRNLVSLILMALVGMLVIMLLDLQNIRKQLAVSFINKPLELISTETMAFFTPIENTLQAATEHGTLGAFTIGDTASVNQYFTPILLHFPQISSVGVADNHGYEHDLIKTSGEILTRTMGYNNNFSTAHWSKLISTSNSTDSTWKPIPLYHNARLRPWHKGAIEHSRTPYWSAPYIFNTRSGWGITVSSTYPDYSLSDSLAILALDLTLADLSSFISKVHISKSGFSLLLTQDMQVVERPPTISNPLAYRRALKTLKGRAGLGNAWEPFKFELNDGIWWAQFNKLEIKGGDYLIVGIVTPQKETMVYLNQTGGIIYVGIATTILLVVGLFWSHKHVANANKKLKEYSQQTRKQSHLVRQKNNDILSSILYAKRIQRAVMPTEEKLAKVIPNSFVLYLPKDVISGDFYWIRQRDNTIYFAVADCTGHGVPGAFMSILGMDLLKVTFLNNHTLSPAQLLSTVRDELIKTLVSDSHKTTDGMDVGLCSFDRENQTLKFAGAFSKLILVRRKHHNALLEVKSDEGSSTLAHHSESDTHQVYVVKGNRFPVGHAYPGQYTGFVDYSFKILPGDTIYLTSDGYVGQFGGEKGRKFGQKRFRQLLLNIQSLAVKRQGKELRKVLQDWKKDEEQVDDICIMGVQPIE